MERKLDKLILALNVIIVALLVFSIVSTTPKVEKEVVNKNVSIIVEGNEAKGFKGENCINKTEIAPNETIKGAEGIFC